MRPQGAVVLALLSRHLAVHVWHGRWASRRLGRVVGRRRTQHGSLFKAEVECGGGREWRMERRYGYHITFATNINRPLFRMIAS